MQAGWSNRNIARCFARVIACEETRAERGLSRGNGRAPSVRAWRRVDRACRPRAVSLLVSSVFDHPAFTASLFYPSPVTSPPPPDARDLFVDVASDARLHVRVHARPTHRVTVLLFHGNGEVVADYDSAARDFAYRGANLAVADYRGYGQSTGSPSARALLADARPVFDAVRDALPDTALVVMGRSLGGNCAAELAQHPALPAAGFIFESAPADLDALVRRRGIRFDGPLPEEDLAVFDPLRKVARCMKPALVLHGESDALIAPSEARATFDALGSREKELVLVPGRGHNDVSLSTVYWDALARFLAAR